MKAESKIFLFLVIFFVVVLPAYAYVTYSLDGAVELIGTTALALTLVFCLMIWGFLVLTGKTIDLRPEDRKGAEVVDAAGEVGFFPASSIWPFWAAVVCAVIVLGAVFGWWISLIGAGIGIWAVMGWCYEFYVGDYKH